MGSAIKHTSSSLSKCNFRNKNLRRNTEFSSENSPQELGSPAQGAWRSTGFLPWWGVNSLVVNDHLWLSLGLGNSRDSSPSDNGLGMLGQVYELFTGTKGGLQQQQRAPGRWWQILYKLLNSETVLHLNASVAHKPFWSLCLFLFCLSPFGNNCNHLPTSYQRYSHPLLSDCFISVPGENSLLFFMLN